MGKRKLHTALATVLLMLVALSLPRAATAVVPMQYQCSATYDAAKSYCTKVNISPWRFTLTDLPGGASGQGPYPSKSAALGRLAQMFVYPANVLCSVTLDSIDPPYYAPLHVGIAYRFSSYTNYTFTGGHDDSTPCSWSQVVHPTIDEIEDVGCPPSPEPGVNWSLIYDATDASTPYCAISWTKVRKPPCKCDLKKGNPGFVMSGVKTQSVTDFAARGNSPLRFERTYNSNVALANGVSASKRDYYTPIGVGWAATYFQKITFNPADTHPTATVTRPDGSTEQFRLLGGVMTGDLDNPNQLVRSVDGLGNTTSWTYTIAADVVETYDAAGRLSTVKDRAGILQTVSYAAPDLVYPATVADSFGNQLAFTYDTGNFPKLASVTLPGGTHVDYAFSVKNNLTTVTFADGKSNTYHYESTSYTGQESLLTGITDETNIRLATYAYDGDGLLMTTEHAGGVNHYSFTYNSDDSRVVVDPLGKSRTYGGEIVDGARRPTSLTAPTPGTNEAKLLTYDLNGNVIARKDFNNNLTCYAFDTSRNLETTRVEGFASTVLVCPASLATYTPAPGTRERKIATAWHATYRLPTSITEANRTISFSHDANGNVLTRTVTDTSVVPSVSRAWAYTYNAFGRVLTEDGPRTDVTDVNTYAYYACTTGFQCGQLNTITNALGHVTTYNSYNAHVQPTQVTDANGLVTSLAYDLRQRLTDRCVGGALPSCSGGEITHLDYWPTGLLKKVTNPDGSFVEYTYDAAHRLTQINDGALNKVVYTLDNMGNRTAENTYDPSNALRRTHTRVFNTLNQLWKDVNAAGTANVTTIFGYDTNGNQNTTSAPLSRNSTSLYDELNRLKQITDPASGNTLFSYDANDNLTSVTDPRTLVTSYTYTGFGDLKTQTSPDTGLTTNVYDTGGNLDTSTDSRGVITDYDYDAASRVTSASFTLGGTTDQTISYAYDAGTNQKGRLTSASDASHSLAWTYDTQGRITGKGQTAGGVTLSIGYGYNAAGQLSSTVLPSGSTIGFGYDTNGQVTSLTLNGSTTILNAITYDPFGPITSWSWGNGTAASRAFDADGKITQVDNASGASLRNYAYDDAFRITGITDAGNSALSWTYGYDVLDRLNSASKTGTSQGWTYDANGNRLAETGTTPSAYTNAGTSNRVSSIAGSLPRTYAYDTAGNTLSYAGATFTYNNRGRMVTATNGGVTATYTYNALGQRIKRTASGVATLYVYDDAGHLAGEYTAAGALVQETVWLGDIPVAMLRPNGLGGVILYYVHADHLNTPRLVTDTSNNIRWKWDSDPFGTTQPNENPASLGTFTYNVRFPGQQYDPVVGLHYNYFRDYDPAIGRYMESDPIGLGGGWNTYSYVSDSPVRYADRLGLKVDCHTESYKEMEIQKIHRDKSTDGPKVPMLGPGPGGGKLGLGAEPTFPSRANPRGAMNPSVDVPIHIWLVHWHHYWYEDGYRWQTFFTGFTECKETDPCKAPNEYVLPYKGEVSPWTEVVTQKKWDELWYDGIYGKTNVPIPLDF